MPELAVKEKEGFQPTATMIHLSATSELTLNLQIKTKKKYIEVHRLIYARK